MQFLVWFFVFLVAVLSLYIFIVTDPSSLPIVVSHESQSKPRVSVFTQFKPVDCIKQKIMPCFQDDDCAVFCTRADLKCFKNKCVIPPPTTSPTVSCNKRNGGQLVLKGIDSLGEAEWECQCRRPELFSGAHCQTKQEYFCKDGILQYDLSGLKEDFIKCVCPEGFNMRYINRINPASRPIPTCVSSKFKYSE